MKKYKLTNQNLQTYNRFQWEIGKKVKTSGKDELCSSGWLHYYHHPLLAILLNPIHADINKPRLFEVSATGKHLNNNGLKGGCTCMKLVKEIELPLVTLNQKVAFGILCSLEVYQNKKYITWAKGWLSGEDRSAAAADAAYAAYAAAYAAADAAADAAAAAADAAAADAAADAAAAAADAAADAAYAAYAAYAAANAAADAAANAAAYAAAYAAADAAADAAAAYAAKFDLIKIAKKALKYV